MTVKNRFVRAEWKDYFDRSIRLALHYRGKSLASFPITIAASSFAEQLSEREAIRRAEQWAADHGFSGIKFLGGDTPGCSYRIWKVTPNA